MKSLQLAHTVISIHALTRSATYTAEEWELMMSDFNPRTHKECDNGHIKVKNITLISIHALTRSATFSMD